MSFEWDETTEERTVTVTISDDSDVTASEVREAVEELFKDGGGGSNDVTTDNGKRRFERGYTGGGN